MEYLDKPSIEAEPAAEVSQVSPTSNLQDSTIDYLVNDSFPMEILESRKLQIRAARYTCGMAFSSEDPTPDHISAA